jgi:LacI family transcriptional regulator
MQRRAATITDVAKLARVSVGTVSNVLSGARKVSQERRQRVLDAIEQLGFKQNMLAQGLRRKSSPVVGLCVPLTSTSYFSALVDAFEDVASSRGFAVMQVLTQQDPAREKQRIEELLGYRVGGLLLVPSMEPGASYEMIEKSGVPLVVVDRPAGEYSFDQVTFANRKAMQDVAGRLIELGHRRILFCVQQRRLSVTTQRIEGLRYAIRKSGEAVQYHVLTCAPDEAGFLEQIRQELSGDAPPTAVIVSNSTLASWIVRSLHRLKVKCPKGVSVFAFGEPDWADLVTPRLSVVRQPIEAIARTAWELLIRRMNGAEDPAAKIEIEGEVIMRESTGPPPIAPKPKRRRSTAKAGTEA